MPCCFSPNRYLNHVNHILTVSQSHLQDRYLAILSNGVSHNHSHMSRDNKAVPIPRLLTFQLIVHCSTVQDAVFELDTFLPHLHRTYHFHSPHNGCYSSLAFLSGVCGLQVLTPMRQTETKRNNWLSFLLSYLYILHILLLTVIYFILFLFIYYVTVIYYTLVIFHYTRAMSSRTIY